MLIACIMITTFNPTPAVEQRETQSWQRGSNREATGEGKSSFPKPTTPCMTQSFMKPWIHRFWGEMKIATLLHHSLAGTACCPAQHSLHRHGSVAMASSAHGSNVGSCWVCAWYCNTQLFCQPAPHSTCTTQSNYAYWWHGFLSKIRFLLIMITKTALQGKYFGIWALLALLFVRKLMASLALLSRWTM